MRRCYFENRKDLYRPLPSPTRGMAFKTVSSGQHLIFSGCKVPGVGRRCARGYPWYDAVSLSSILVFRLQVGSQLRQVRSTVTASSCPTQTGFLQAPPSLCSSIEQIQPRGLAHSPATYLDSSVAYREELGWDVSLPECRRAFLQQNLSRSLEDPMVFCTGVTARQALNLKLGIKIKKVRRGEELSEKVKTKAAKCLSLTKLQERENLSSSPLHGTRGKKGTWKRILMTSKGLIITRVTSPDTDPATATSELEIFLPSAWGS